MTMHGEGWQPIKTAPLRADDGEGQAMLGWNGCGQHVICHSWENSAGEPVFWNGDVQICATHWMPLPEPPK